MHNGIASSYHRMSVPRGAPLTKPDFCAAPALSTSLKSKRRRGCPALQLAFAGGGVVLLYGPRNTRSTTHQYIEALANQKGFWDACLSLCVYMYICSGVFTTTAFPRHDDCSDFRLNSAFGLRDEPRSNPSLLWCLHPTDRGLSAASSNPKP